MSDPAGDHVVIRSAKLTDAADLASLMVQLGYATTAAEMKMRLNSILPDSRYRTLVALVDDKICGMVGTFCHLSYEHNDLSARILALVVDAQMRSRGVGRALVQATETELAASNIARVSVNTRLTRHEAHLFYEQLRYEKNGFRYVKTLAPPAG